MVSAQLGLWSAMKGGAAESNEEIEKLQTHLDGANSAIERNKKNAGALRGEFSKATDAANNTWKAYDEQAIAAEKAILRLTSATQNNGASMSELQVAVSGTTAGFDLLDRARLDRLNSAIEAANQKLREMQKEADNAKLELQELNAEIEREKGNDNTADKLRLQTEKTRDLIELEDKIETARKQNNTDLVAIYEQQRSKLQELYNLKKNNLDADIREREQEKRKTESDSNKTSKTNSSGTGSSSGTGTTHTLKLLAPDGQSATAFTQDETSVNQFLDVLGKAGLRLTR